MRPGLRGLGPSGNHNLLAFFFSGYLGFLLLQSRKKNPDTTPLPRCKGREEGETKQEPSGGAGMHKVYWRRLHGGRGEAEPSHHCPGLGAAACTGLSLVAGLHAGGTCASLSCGPYAITASLTGCPCSLGPRPSGCRRPCASASAGPGRLCGEEVRCSGALPRSRNTAGPYPSPGAKQ